MTITKNLDGTKLTIALEGRLDTTTSPQLEATWRSLPTSLPPDCACCFPPRRS